MHTRIALPQASVEPTWTQREPPWILKTTLPMSPPSISLCLQSQQPPEQAHLLSWDGSHSLSHTPHVTSEHPLLFLAHLFKVVHCTKHSLPLCSSESIFNAISSLGNSLLHVTLFPQKFIVFFHSPLCPVLLPNMNTYKSP
jgi:hypothetical protein